jgi:hypothetical protein
LLIVAGYWLQVTVARQLSESGFIGFLDLQDVFAWIFFDSITS